MPQLRIDAANNSLRPTVRDNLQSLIGAIEAGGMTASDIAGLMDDWQMDLLYTDGADWNAANIVVGSLVRELGRAIGSAKSAAGE